MSVDLIGVLLPFQQIFSLVRCNIWYTFRSIKTIHKISDYFIMPFVVFREKDADFHKELIQNAYQSFINDIDMLNVIFKNSKKVRVNVSIFKLFSSLIRSILRDYCSDPFNGNNLEATSTSYFPEIILADFSEEHWKCLAEILSNGATSQETVKNIENDIEKIKCLAECFGIDMTNLVFSHDGKGESKSRSIKIRTLSLQFIDSDVPNDLDDNGEECDYDPDEVTFVEQPSSNVIEILASDEECFGQDICDELSKEAAVDNVVHNYTEQKPSITCEIYGASSINYCSLPSKANNNEKSATSFFCYDCDIPREFNLATDLSTHKIVAHQVISKPRIRFSVNKSMLRFPSAKELAEHIRSQAPGPYFCQEMECSRNWRVGQQSALMFANHIITNHKLFTLENSYVTCSSMPYSDVLHISCNICPRKFVSADDLAQHTADVHATVFKNLASKLVEDIILLVKIFFRKEEG